MQNFGTKNVRAKAIRGSVASEGANLDCGKTPSVDSPNFGSESFAFLHRDGAVQDTDLARADTDLNLDTALDSENKLLDPQNGFPGSGEGSSEGTGAGLDKVPNESEARLVPNSDPSLVGREKGGPHQWVLHFAPG